jgi:adenylyl-sulfate kinase
VAIVPETSWEVEAQLRADRWAAAGVSGGTLWFTGLSGAGKSTIATAVEERLLASGRLAYRLDGDKLRTGLNADLGFDRSAREENVRRVAEVARLLADAGTVALAAVISPYASGRDFARRIHLEAGLPYAEIYVATSLAVCEARDVKGLYARARAGQMEGMTGVDDPYEPPVAPELVVEGHGDLPTTVEAVLAVVAGWGTSAA